MTLVRRGRDRSSIASLSRVVFQRGGRRGFEREKRTLQSAASPCLTGPTSRLDPPIYCVPVPGPHTLASLAGFLFLFA